MEMSIETYVYVESVNAEFGIKANYYYQPEEKETGESGFSLGYPGCPAEVEEIYDIVCIDKDANNVKKFSKLLENEEIWEDIETQIEEAIWEDLSKE